MLPGLSEGIRIGAHVKVSETRWSHHGIPWGLYEKTSVTPLKPCWNLLKSLSITVEQICFLTSHTRSIHEWFKIGFFYIFKQSCSLVTPHSSFSATKVLISWWHFWKKKKNKNIHETFRKMSTESWNSWINFKNIPEELLVKFWKFK